MRILIHKAKRELQVVDGGQALLRCAVALGSEPLGAKRRQGDGRTPEGNYFICLVKEQGKYGRSLGLSYPGLQDAEEALSQGLIDGRTYENILLAHAEHRRPPWGSPMGGEIYIHEGGTASDWTAGCIALDEKDMDVLFPLWPEVEDVEILP